MAAEYQKISISMPADVIERLKERAGPRGVSAYVNDAVQHRLQMDGLAELVAEMEAEHGPADRVEVQRIIDEYFT
jgi:hypothetical protein